MTWVLLFVLSATVLPNVAGQLKGGFGAVDTESRRARELLSDKFGMTDAGLIVVFSSDQLTTRNPVFIGEMEKVLSPLRERTEVTDITTFYDGGPPSMVSGDGSTTYAVVSLNQSVDEAIEAFPTINETMGQGVLQVWSTGGIAIFSEINQTSEKDLRRGEIIAIPLVLLALIFVFRSIVAAGIPVAMGLIGVSSALALLFFLAQGMDISIFALNIVSFLGLGVAVDYSLLVVSRFREELKYLPRDEAVARTVATSGRTILYSGITSIVGLSSLLLFDFMMLKSVGLGGILVIAVSLVLALTLLPAILSLVGHRVNALPVLPSLSKPRGYWRRLATGVMRHPVLVAVPLIILLIGLGIPFLGVNLGLPWASVLPKESPSRQGWELVAERMGPGELTPIIVAAQYHRDPLDTTQTNELQGFFENLKKDPAVDRIESIFGPDGLRDGSGVNAALVSNYVNADTTIIRVYSRFSPVEEETKDLVRRVRSFDPEGNVTLLVTGATADLMDSIDVMYSDFPVAIGFVIAASYISLLILFRSVFLPLKAVLINLMSIFASYGALVFIFQEGHFQRLLGFRAEGFTEPTIPILLFAVIFGLSMDYEIFLLSRIKESYKSSQDTWKSVAHGLEVTGPIITNAALILILVAIAFVSADIVIVKALGVGVAIAIFLDATVARAFLVPALMKIMDRWNWWAPSFLKRVLPEW